MKTRYGPFGIVQLFMLVAVLALGASPALATIANDGVFQVDGDVLHTPTGSGDDWRDLLTCSGSTCTASGGGGAATVGWVGDPAPASIFTTGGSKDQLDVCSWRWTNGNVPDKDDLTSGFAARYGSAAGGDSRLYFGADRLANNGDAQIGTWFFQTTVFLCGGTGPNSVPAGTGGCVTGTFVGQSGALAHHEIGDILVLSNFTNGGGTSNIAAFVVSTLGPAAPACGSVVLTQIVAGAGSNIACNGDGSACAATNSAPTPALGAYYVPKQGTAGTYPSESFFEGGLDLTAFNLQAECFGSFLHETRSSQSITATLKDFVLSKFQSCEASATTQIHLAPNGTTDIQGTVIPRNSSIFDEIILTSGVGGPDVHGSATFTFFTNGTCQGTGTSEGPINLSVTDPATATTAGVSKAQSSATGALAGGSYSFQATYNGDDPNYPLPITTDCETITVSSPNITVSKTCTAAVNPDGVTVTVSFSGQVCATDSDEDLSGVTLSDDQGGVTTPPSSTIAKGQCSSYSGSYQSNTASNSDTVTASATGAFGETVGPTSKTATCSPPLNPAITVDKVCTAAVNSTGTGVNVSISNGTNGVCNGGNVQLTGITLVDDHAGSLTPASTTLAPGQCTTYSGSYSSTTKVNSDTVTATGTGALGSGTVNNTGSANCEASLTSSIVATKDCTNRLVSNDAVGRLVVKARVSGTVCNTGNTQVTLSSLVDSQAGSLFGSLVPSPTLGVPGSGTDCATYSGSYFPTSLTSGNGTTSDTVTAQGTGAITNAPVSANKPASCDLCPLAGGTAPNGN